MKILKCLSASIGVLFVMYLIGSFASASFNIETWVSGFRGFVAFIGLVLSIATFIFVKEEFEK